MYDVVLGEWIVYNGNDLVYHSHLLDDMQVSINPCQNAILRLQVFTMINRMPFPTYETFVHSQGFKTTGTVNHFSASATATSKKKARHQCAIVLLEKILKQKDPNLEIVQFVERDSSQTSITSGTLNLFEKSSHHNYVGVLNEKCMTSYRMPQYMDIPMSNMQFGLQCMLGDLTTCGYGMTKKQAKQIAAKFMLEKLEDPACPIDLKSKFSLYGNEVRCVKHVIKKFKQLSIKTDSVVTKTEFPTYTCVEPKINQEARPNWLQQNLLSVEEAIEKLAKLNFIYHIVILQYKPYILILKTQKKGKFPSYTFIEHGNTLEEARFKLFNQTIEYLTILMYE